MLAAEAAVCSIGVDEVAKVASSYTSIKEYVQPAQLVDLAFVRRQPSRRDDLGQPLSVCGDAKMLS